MYSNLFIYNSLFPKCTQLKTEFRMFSQLLSSQINSSLLLSPHISRSQLTAGSLLAASWRLRGCCPSSHQIRTQSSQSAVSTCLNSQHKPTHTLMGGAKYVKHGTWSWSRTNTCARAWRLKYTKYRIFNHVYDDPPPHPSPHPKHHLMNHGFLICSISFRWNCWLKGFQSFLPRKQQPKQRRSTGRSRNPHRCRASDLLPFLHQWKSHLALWSSLKYPNNSWVDPVLASSCWLSKILHLKFLCWSSLFFFL